MKESNGYRKIKGLYAQMGILNILLVLTLIIGIAALALMINNRNIIALMIFLPLTLLLLFYLIYPAASSHRNYNRAAKSIDMEKEADNYQKYLISNNDYNTPYIPFYTPNSFCFFNGWNIFNIIVRKDYQAVEDITVRIGAKNHRYMTLVLTDKDGNSVSFKNIRLYRGLNTDLFIEDFKAWFKGEPITPQKS